MSVAAAGLAKVRFTDAQTKYIAEFYVNHFDVLRRDQEFSTGVNQERSRLYNQLTQEMNARWGKQFKIEQVHHKLKNMKREVRDLVIEYDNGLRSLNGEDPDVPQMSEAEAIIVSKIISHRNSASSTRADRLRSPNLDGLIRVPTPDEDEQDDEEEPEEIVPVVNEDFLAARAVQQEFDAAPPTLQPTIQPGGLRTLTPVRNSFAARRVANAQKRKVPPTPSSSDGLKGLKRSVLQLQRRVLEGELQMQQEKRMTLAKFSAAIDEFRRYVAEQRMATRGVDVTNVPIDIPPGMQGIGIE